MRTMLPGDTARTGRLRFSGLRDGDHFIADLGLRIYSAKVLRKVGPNTAVTLDGQEVDAFSPTDPVILLEGLS